VSLSKRILLGLVAGVVVGLFLGDKASFLDLPARGFVQLLQVTVLPYVVTSLVAGVAGGTAAQARRLASKGGLALALLWALSLALVMLSPLALPPEKGGLLFATTELSSEPRIDWLDLYIPSNPFRSLANNVVPAVVVFSTLLGVAILGLPGKERILGPLALVNDALGRAGSLLVKLTPYGLFAIAGHSAGTLRLEEFERLQAFLLVYVGLALILTLWVLPGVVSVLTGLSYRRILSLAQDPLLTAFVTANVFIVLPLLAERGKALLAKLLSLVFVLFAGWFVGAPVPTREPPRAGEGHGRDRPRAASGRTVRWSCSSTAPSPRRPGPSSFPTTGASSSRASTARGGRRASGGAVPRPRQRADLVHRPRGGGGPAPAPERVAGRVEGQRPPRGEARLLGPRQGRPRRGGPALVDRPGRPRALGRRLADDVRDRAGGWRESDSTRVRVWIASLRAWAEPSATKQPDGREEIS
jgi:hypothetical protein